MKEQLVDIVFDGAPGHDAPRFVEVDSPPGKSIRFGWWVRRDDGYWALRFPWSEHCSSLAHQLEDALRKSSPRRQFMIWFSGLAIGLIVGFVIRQLIG